MIIFFYLFYFLFFGLIFFKDKTYFLIVYIIFLFFNDFVFILLDPFFSSNYLFIIKSWREWLFIFVIILAIYKTINVGLKKATLFQIPKSVIISLIVSIFIGVIIGFLNRNSILSVILDFREYFLNFLTLLILFLFIDFKSVNQKSLTNSIILLTLVLIGFATFEYVTFDGDIAKSWKYVFKLDREYLSLREHRLGVQSLKSDFIRKGNLRAGGFFVSSLEYALFLSYIFLYSLLLLIQSRSIIKLSLLFFLVTIFFGLFLSQTRTAFIVILIGLVILTFLRAKKNYIVIVSIPVFVALLTYLNIYYNFGNTNDASTLGRLAQYYEFFTNFSFIGLGLGTTIRNSYDSLYLSVFTTFGVFGIFYMMFLLFPLRLLWAKLTIDYKNPYHNILIKACFMFFVVSIYIFTFQYSLASMQLLFLFLLSLLALNKTSENA